MFRYNVITAPQKIAWFNSGVHGILAILSKPFPVSSSAWFSTKT
jgi:hypothetical protein